MFKKLSAIWFAACLLTGLGGCNNAADPAHLQIMREGRPALWKVSSDQPGQPGTAYLFGTIHILPKDAKWRTPLLERSISESDRLIVEVTGLEDTQNAAKIFAKLAFSDGLPALDERIKPSLRPVLDAAIGMSPLASLRLNRMETWAAALSLASSQTNELGLGGVKGAEDQLTKQFKKTNKPIEGLETIEQQLGYFDQLPEVQQRQMLTNVIEDADESQANFEQLFNAWISGDVEGLVTLSEEGILLDPKIRESLLVRRNQDWADQLAMRLRQPGRSFVAVGAAHLVGPFAVQNMLEKHGFKIEKIQ